MLLILWRNGNSTGLGGEGLTPRETTTLIGDGTGSHSFIGCDNKAAFGIKQSGLGSIQFVIAEYFHGMFGGNEYHTASGHGIHTFAIEPVGIYSIGSQIQAGGSSNVVSGWDRNHLSWYGWQDDNLTLQKTNLISAIDVSGDEIATDLSIPAGPLVQEFILRDFVTTGDAIRIKLPHINWQSVGDTKNQYIWFENHQKLSTYDVNKYEHLSCADAWSTGIYSYVQVGKDVKSNVGVADVWNAGDPNQPNSLAGWLKPLNAEGNWDFNYRRDLVTQINPTPNQQCIWGNKSIPIDYNQSVKNSFTGMCDQYNFYNWDGNKLKIDDPYRPGGSEVIAGNVEYNAHAFGDADDAFSPITQYNELSMSTNPSPVPVYTFKTANNGGHNSSLFQTSQSYENRTIWLNGIKIEFVDQLWNSTLGAYDIKVRVSWDNYDIENDVRWCGNIKLSANDFNQSEPSVNLLPNNTILINRGLSSNKHIAVDQIGGEYIFSDPTVFTCLANSIFHMEHNSSVRVEGLDSDFVLKSGSRLEIHDGAEFIVGYGGRLIVEDGAEIALHDGGKIIIEDGGEMIYENTNLGSPMQLGSFGSTGTQGELRIHGTLTVKDNTVLDADGNGYVHFMPFHTLDLQGNSYVRLFGEDKNKKMLEVAAGATLTLDEKNFIVADGGMKITGTVNLLDNVSVISNSQMYGGGLIYASGNTSFKVQFCDVGGPKIQVENTLGAPFFDNNEIHSGNPAVHILNCNITNVQNNDIHNNTKGFVFENSNLVNFTNNVVEINGIGIEILNSITCNIRNSEFKYSSVAGIKALNTQAVYFYDTRVHNNGGLGLHADFTEVYLRNGTSFDSNWFTAIKMEGSTDLSDAMLTVGDVGCGKISNNNTEQIAGVPAVIGKNIILNIDAEIHQGGSNSLEPNDFSGNYDLTFDICYWTLNPPVPIMANGNFWGTVGNVSFGLNNGNVSDFFKIKRCPGTTLYTIGGVDAQNHSTCIPTTSCEDCNGANSGNGNGTGSGGSSSQGVINGGGLFANPVYIDCIKKVKEQYVNTIGEEYLNAKEVFVLKDTLPAREMYKELSMIDLEMTPQGWKACHRDDMCEAPTGNGKGKGKGNNNNDRIVKKRCAQVIRVARVIIDANPNVNARMGASAESRGFRELTKSDKSDDLQFADVNSFSVYPNPNSGAFTIELTEEFQGQNLTVKVYDVLGKEVHTDKINSDSNNSVKLSEEKQGVYFLVVYDELGMLVGKDKVVVE